MTIKSISNSYWRSIKRGKRTFDSIPAEVKDDVKILAQNDVISGVISKVQYKDITGEDY